MSGPKILNLNPREDSDRNDIPVSVLQTLEAMEKAVNNIAGGLAGLTQLVLEALGQNMDGHVWQGMRENSHMALNNSGEILAIVKVLEDQNLVTREQLAEIKRTEFDEPLQQRIDEERARIEQAMKDAKQEAAIKELGIITPSVNEARVIGNTKT